MFAFVTLFRDPLPPSPGIIRSDYLSYVTIKDFRQYKAMNIECNWKLAYAVSTSDNYLHLITGRKSDIPDKSFFLQVNKQYIHIYIDTSMLLLLD